jgi:hypothetical protein
VIVVGKGGRSKGGKWKMMLEYYITKGARWFRIFGFGLQWKNTTIHPLLFSQRNGYTRGITIGKWWIGFLTDY